MCSRSPTAPMTVTSSPMLGCALAPALSMRSITAWTSSEVAEGFITIIMGSGSLKGEGAYWGYGGPDGADVWHVRRGGARPGARVADGVTGARRPSA